MPTPRQPRRPARRIPLFCKRGPMYGSPLAGTPLGNLMNALRDVAHRLKPWPLAPKDAPRPGKKAKRAQRPLPAP